MEKWICKVCGYTHHGDEAPERCPDCGAPKSQFELRVNSKGCAFNLLFILLILSIILIVVSCSTKQTVDNHVIKKVDLVEYLGKWYEIARIDHNFEKGMQQCTATYSFNDDGTIKVRNQGMKNGKMKTSIGKAKKTSEPGVLRVSFFGPFFSDYRILMLAEDYSYALVGGSGDNYLWILSRTPELKKETCDSIIREAKRRGYDTDKLVWVKQ